MNRYGEFTTYYKNKYNGQVPIIHFLQDRQQQKTIRKTRSESWCIYKSSMLLTRISIKELGICTSALFCLIIFLKSSNLH